MLKMLVGKGRKRGKGKAGFEEFSKIQSKKEKE
jgi:hypothetical protein